MRGERSSGLRDSVEISDTAYKKFKESGELKASSGKDELRITRGDNENEVVVHFDDSALVNRAVSRGYITINGKDIALHDETKTALQNADKEAEQMRRKAFTSYVMEHEAAVAKQQGEAWAKAYEELNDSLLSKLLEPDSTDSQEDVPEGVSWSDFDWKTYNVSMDISLDNMVIGDIHVNESNVAH